MSSEYRVTDGGIVVPVVPEPVEPSEEWHLPIKKGWSFSKCDGRFGFFR